MASVTSPASGTSGIRRGAMYLAALAGVAVALVLVISYFFHTTSVEVVARVNDEVFDAIESGGSVTLELHDQPLGGILLDRYELSEDDISLVAGNAVFEIGERTRNLPSTSHIQLCIDPDGDGHSNCSSEAVPPDGELSDVDVVSCTRQQLVRQRDSFSSTSVSYANAVCQEVQAPLIAGPGNLGLTIDDVPSALALVVETDLSELINEALLEFEQDQDVQLTVDDVALFVQGLDHDDDQRLSLVASELTISNGNTVDLSPFLGARDDAAADIDTNTDDQSIEAALNGSTLSVLLEDGGQTDVDLSSLATDTDDQELDLTGNELVLSNGDAPDSVVDLSGFFDDTDTLVSLDCAIGELAEWNGTAWSCTDVSALETLTTVGYDIVTQTVTFAGEDGNVTTVPIASLETTTVLNNTLAVGNVIGSYTDEDGASIDILETVTTLVDNGDQTFSYTAEDGSVSTLDATDLETLTTLTNTVAAGNLIGTYTDEDGVNFDIAETITAIVDNGDQTFSFTHEDGSVSTLDVTDLETLTTLTQVVVGNTIATYVDEDGVAWDVDETITSLVDNGDQTISFTHEDGSATTLDIAVLETLTTVTNTIVGNTIATYVDEDGVTWDIDESITSLVDNGDQTITFTHEDGSTTTLDLASLETLTTVTNTITGNTIGTYTDEDGVSFDIDETITSLVDNGDGTFSFTAEDGTVSTIDAASQETLTTVTNTIVGNTIATYTDEDGVAFDIDETITTLTDNGDGTFAFTSEDGTVTTVDTLDIETITSVNQIVTGNTIAEYIAEDGTVFDIDESITTLTDNGDGTFTFTSEDGSITTVDTLDIETLTTLTSTLAVGNLIGTYKNEAGASIDLNESITTLTDNGDGTFTFTSEDGTATTINTTDIETLSTITDVLTTGQTIATYTDEAGESIDILESVTELIDNGDGTYSFTSEDGTLSTITDGDTLGALSCAPGETAQWNGTAWACATDSDTDTDDQRISNFSLSGSTLTITIEDGNTVDVDLSLLDTDTGDQTLTLAGSILSISEGNSVDLAALVASGDSQTLSVSGGTITISNGNSIDFPVLTIYEEFYAGGSDDGRSQTWGRNVRMSRNAVGQWTVRFGSPHPDGTDYAIDFSVEEGTARDSVLLQVVQGSMTANGFDIFLATGDNGGTTDSFVDTPFTISVDAPIEVLGPAN